MQMKVKSNQKIMFCLKLNIKSYAQSFINIMLLNGVYFASVIKNK